jgi:two-component system response regulator FlrC
VRGLSPEALRALQAHAWPGNVRELQNVIERAVILSGEGPLLEPEHLGLGAAVPTTSPAAAGGPVSADASPGRIENGAPQTGDRFPTLAEMEKHHILAALNRCRGNRTHAARLLGISIRTLRNKLNEYHGHSAAPDSALAGSV